MLNGIDIESVKAYNNSLKEYKAKAASLNAEIEYTNKEIDSICKELSNELGVEVTRDNVDTIYNEQLEKIESTLKSGMAIINKIQREENEVNAMNNQI